MSPKFEAFLVFLVLLSLNLWASPETSGGEPFASLLITDPPFKLSHNYSLSLNVVLSSEGAVCELVGGCHGVDPERASVNLSEADFLEIVKTLELAKWMLRIDKAGNRTRLEEPGSEPMGDFTEWSHYFIVSFNNKGDTFYRVVSPHPDPVDARLLDSFLKVKPIREAAIRLVRQAMEGPAAKSVQANVWEGVLDVDL